MIAFSERPAARAGGAARKIILQCLFWYLVVAGTFTAFEAATVSAKVDREIAERILTMEKRIEPALARALWNLDHDLVALILSGVVDDPSVRRLELRDSDGRSVVELDADDRAAAARRSGDGASRVFPLTHVSPGKPARPIGELVVFPSSELRTARIRETILFSVGRAALIVFLLSVILSIAIERGLGRPLREFAKRISEVDPAAPGKAPLVLHGASGGELTLAAEAFNAMARKAGETMTALVESRSRLWTAFDDSPIALWEEDFSAVKRRLDDEAGRGVQDWAAYFESAERIKEFCRLIKIIDVNRSTLSLLDADDKSRVLGPLSDAVGEQAILALRMEFIALAGGALSWEGESVYQAADGRPTVLSIRLRIVPGHEKSWDRVLVSMVDISEQKRAESVLRQSLKEKDLLLKEVHHRVKNNLQIICSLIGIQRGSSDPDSEAAASLSDIESRVWSMALVHELLYESRDFAALDFSGYVAQLCDRILAGYADAPGRIRLESLIADDVRLVLDKAIPCGLLINELVVNSFKHAFPDGRKGTIRVSMARSSGGWIDLVVADDGVGLDDLSDLIKPRSIGFMLVESLALQLGGRISFRGTDGLRAELRFPESVSG